MVALLGVWAGIKKIWSAVTSTAGLIIMAVIGSLIWLHFHDAALEKRVRGECRAEQLQATLDEAKRQIKVMRQASEDADKRAATDSMEIARLSVEVENTRADLGESRKNECRVPRATGKRLQNIR